MKYDKKENQGPEVRGSKEVLQKPQRGSLSRGGSISHKKNGFDKAHSTANSNRRENPSGETQEEIAKEREFPLSLKTRGETCQR